MADFLFSEGPIRVLQDLLSPALDGLFLLLTEAGNGALLIAFAILVYWIWDKRLGLLLGVLTLSGVALSGLLKSVIGMPRPPPDLHLTPVTGNGFPSGHSQYAATFWATVAASARGVWMAVSVVVIALVALSRVYLGVHYVGDVVGGVGIGLALAAGGWFLHKSSLWNRVGVGWRVATAVVLPSVSLGTLVLLGHDFMEAWGFLVGFSVGYVMEGSLVGLRRAGRRRSGLRLLIGAPALVGLYALSLLLPSWAILGYSLAFGLAASLLLPWVFVRVESRVLQSRDRR